MTLRDNYLVFMYEDDLRSEDYLSSALKNKSRIGITQFSNASHLVQNLLLDPDMIVVDYITYKNRNKNHGENIFTELKKAQIKMPVVVVAPTSERPLAYDFAEDRLIKYTEKNELCVNRLKRVIADYREVKVLKKKFMGGSFGRAAAFSLTVAVMAAIFFS